MAAQPRRITTTRASSDERREQVIEAAVSEFAEHGYHATSTSAIAKRAGISQPYIYALFPNKRELFLATHAHVIGHIRHAMGEAYMELLEQRDEIVLQMQAHAAAGDPALRTPIRREFIGVIDHVERVAGISRQKALDFVAVGMLLNVIAALDLPDDYLPVELD
jgi:AcrR family transcriptional regulator